jgi:hypothetical protein
MLSQNDNTKRGGREERKGRGGEERDERGRMKAEG